VISSIVILACTFQYSLQAHYHLQNNSNKKQKEYIKVLEDHLARSPGKTYYDVIGVLQKQSEFRHFVGPNQAYWNREIAKLLQENPPDVFIAVKKAEFIVSEIGPLLDSQYIDLGNGIYLKSLFQARPNIEDLKSTLGKLTEPVVTLELEKIENGQPLRTVVVRSREEALSFISGFKETDQLPFRITKLYDGDAESLKKLENAYLMFRFDSEF